MKTSFLLLAALMLSGCGTIDTVFREDAVASEKLKERKSYCGGVPRIYSGVTYDFCSLHAPEPENGTTHTGPASNQAMLLDMAVSGVLDTLLLPYTIYQQQTDGSLIIAE
ncbi:YceK/YidQ family lipoprotein [Pseudomonas sp. GM17]|uniref:YceK/YidQ family lipoprotein n=1 Tax=Pseudomonas sp. GM17 TaxID=1144323 RepID=UPI000272568A|nr:YceK/YidQ family lipoprotein [Pseudomonas sp. GM17]WIE48410.1 YceK/YidQ family lipoprotein [Pseudomonas sp. GM17]